MKHAEAVSCDRVGRRWFDASRSSAARVGQTGVLRVLLAGRPSSAPGLGWVDQEDLSARGRHDAGVT